jgi:hypothetical protein
MLARTGVANTASRVAWCFRFNGVSITFQYHFRSRNLSWPHGFTRLSCPRLSPTPVRLNKYPVLRHLFPCSGRINSLFRRTGNSAASRKRWPELAGARPDLQKFPVNFPVFGIALQYQCAAKAIARRELARSRSTARTRRTGPLTPPATPAPPRAPPRPAPPVSARSRRLRA